MMARDARHRGVRSWLFRHAHRFYDIPTIGLCVPAGSGVSFRRRAGAPRLIEWTGERCVPWTPDVQVVYEHVHRYLWAADLVVGRRVLDLGSGEGFGAALLADAAEHVVGIDIDELTVEHSRLNYEGSNLAPSKVVELAVRLEDEKLELSMLLERQRADNERARQDNERDLQVLHAQAAQGARRREHELITAHEEVERTWQIAVRGERTVEI